MASGNAVRRNFVGMERPCSRCGAQIIVTAKMCKHGAYRCATCNSQMAVAYAKRHRDKKRAWNNAYHSRRSGERAATTKAWRERHPEKRAAHQAVQTALRNGTLHRAPCVVCGDAKSHAHHEDYSQPLSVIWLCHAHHMQRHAMLAERQK